MLWMEGRYPVELTIKKLSPERQEKSLQAYKAVLEEYGCQVAGTRTSTAGDQFTMVLLVPRGVALGGMNERLKLKISDDLQGKIHMDLGD